jgi:hypothetical protein
MSTFPEINPSVVWSIYVPTFQRNLFPPSSLLIKKAVCISETSRIYRPDYKTKSHSNRYSNFIYHTPLLRIRRLTLLEVVELFLNLNIFSMTPYSYNSLQSGQGRPLGQSDKINMALLCLVSLLWKSSSYFEDNYIKGNGNDQWRNDSEKKSISFPRPSKVLEQ